MLYLKQSTAVTIKMGPFLDDTDGKTAETALTLSQADFRVSKNGGNFAQKNEASAATHDEIGFYDVSIDATDTNTLGRLLIAVHETGALPVWKEFMVVPANTYDSLISGSDYLDTNAVQVEGSDATDQINAACDTALSDYDAPTKAELDSGLAALNDPTVAAIADAVWDEVLTAATHDVASSAGRRLRQLGGFNVTDGTAQAGGTATITLAATESATDHIYNENLISIIDGTGVGQSRLISEYNGTTKVVTVEKSWEITPDATSEYSILAFSGVLLIDHGIVAAAAVGTITLDAQASSVSDAYVGSMVVISTGTGLGQARLITAYNGTTKVATISPDWTTTPDTTSVYKVVPVGRTIVETLGIQAKADVNAEVDTALSDIHLDHLLATDYDPASKPGTATALLNELVENDAGVSRFTANALEQGPSGSGDWTSTEKEHIRYRLQIDGTQTAPTTDAPTQLPASADAISQDATAADNFETMLDGTGGQALSLGQLKILASGSDHAIHLEGGPTNGHGFYSLGKGGADGIYAAGNHGLEVLGTNATNGSGILAQGNGSSGAGIYAFGSLGDDILGDINGSIGSLGTTAKSDVNAEVADVLKTDTIAEQAQGAPTATPTFEEAIGYLYMALRNRLDVLSTFKKFYNDSGTVIWKKALTDDGTTYTEDEGETGP
jgi:glucokinase